MYVSAIAFLIGITGLCFYPSLPSLVWLTISTLLCAVAMYYLSFPFKKFAALLFFLLLGMTWGVYNAQEVTAWKLTPELTGQTLAVVGTIASIPENKGYYQQFLFDVKQLNSMGKVMPVTARVRLNWYMRNPEQISVGQQWQFQVRLKPGRSFANPGGFDFTAWLLQQKIRAKGYVVKSNKNQRIHEGSWWYAIDHVREDLLTAMNEGLSDTSLKSLIMALTIGDRSQVKTEQWQVLTATGTSHLMAISGLHIGLVAGFFFFIGRFLWRRSERLCLFLAAPKAGALFALVAAFFYSALAGFSVPTQRAFIMISVFMLSLLFNHRVTSWQALGLALFAVLIWDPLSVLSASFWLSFAAVTVILYAFSYRLAKPKTWRQWIHLQAAVTLGLLPLGALFFSQYSLVSPLVNLLAVPWVSFLVVPPALLACALWFVWPSLADLLWQLAVYDLTVLWHILTWFAELPLAQWHLSGLNPWVLSSAVIGVFILLAPKGWPARYLAFLFLLPLGFPSVDEPVFGDLSLTLLDVGQGEAVVLQTANHTVLYDTGPKWGPNFNAGSAVIQPFLRHQGIRHVDRIILSHGDMDHSGGLQTLRQYLPDTPLVTSDNQRFPTAKACVAGESWQYDGVEFEFLYPPAFSQQKGNENSCVLLVTVGDYAVLIPGDIEQYAERYLLDHAKQKLRANILIAPHHGSNTSSSQAFIDAVKPSWVLFAVGYRNRFGFPKPNVVARYRAIDAKLLDTANAGAINLQLSPSGGVVAWGTYRSRSDKVWFDVES